MSVRGSTVESSPFASNPDAGYRPSRGSVAFFLSIFGHAAFRCSLPFFFVSNYTRYKPTTTTTTTTTTMRASIVFHLLTFSFAGGASPRLLRANGNGDQTAIEGVERDSILKEFLFENKESDFSSTTTEAVFRQLNMDDNNEENQEAVERELAPRTSARLRHRNRADKSDPSPIKQA
jgi:hypothetical protein